MATRPKPEKTQIAFPLSRGIYLVSFDPAVGHQIQKSRPAVIIQNDISNRYSPMTIVAAITSQLADPPFPREVIVKPFESGLPKRSAVVVNQIRSVDRVRLLKKMGALSSKSMDRVDEELKISLSLREI